MHVLQLRRLGLTLWLARGDVTHVERKVKVQRILAGARDRNEYQAVTQG